MSSLPIEAYVSPATAANIKTAFGRLFATGKRLGVTVDLLLWRGDVAVPAQNVLLVMAAREAATVRGAAILSDEADGEFRKEGPFDIAEGDRFSFVDSVSRRTFSGRVQTVYPSNGTYTRAAFVAES